MDNAIRLLLIEDDSDDAFFMLNALTEGGVHYRHMHVQTVSGIRSAIGEQCWDLVISDYSLPGFNGLDALEIVRQQCPDTPFILVSGAIGETLAVELMKRGAQDYIMKNDLTRLVPAVKRELQEAQMRADKQRTEHQLQKSEEQYRSLFQSVPIGLYHSAADGRRLSVNMAYLELFGFHSLEECLNTPVVNQYVLAEDYALWRQKLIEQGVLSNFQTRLYKKDGSMIWVKENTKAVEGPSGKVLYYDGSVEDVTAQKNAEEALRASEERYRLLYDLSPDGIFIADCVGRITACNPAVLHITGFENDDFVGQNFVMLSDLLCDETQIIRKQYESLSEENAVCRFEFEWIAKNGDNRWSQMQISRLRQGSIDLGVQAVFRDVTLRKMMALEVKQTRDQLQAIIDHAPLYLYVTDMENRFLLVNRMFHAFFGLEMQAFMGKTIPEIFGDKTDQVYPADILNTYYEQNRLVFENDEPMTFEDEYPGSDGRDMTTLSTKFPLHDDKGKPNSLCTIILDITELKQRERQLQNSLKQKELLLKELHHRVKNNMQLIISLLNLQANRLDDAGLLSAFHTSRDRIYSMALVQDRLYRSKDFSHIDFADYIQEMMEVVLKTYHAHDQITVQPALEALDLGIDSAIPCGLIVNELLTNAVVHAFPGGRHGTVNVTLKALNKGRIYLAVQDDGVGMDPQIEVGSGASMGFRLISILVDQIEGEYNVILGKGTCIEIVFPVQPVYERPSIFMEIS